MQIKEPFFITFQDSWLQEEPMFVEEYINEYKLKVLEDLGEGHVWIENDEGILEWTKVHKYKVKNIENSETDKQWIWTYSLASRLCQDKAETSSERLS